MSTDDPTPCALVKQNSAANCERDVSFFCNATAMFVTRGCRGFFQCGNAHAVTQCGKWAIVNGEQVSYPSGRNCTCLSLSEPAQSRSQSPCIPMVWAATTTNSQDTRAWSRMQATAWDLLTSGLVKRLTINFWDGVFPHALDGRHAITISEPAGIAQALNRSVMPSRVKLPAGGTELQMTTIEGAKGLFFKRVILPVAAFPFDFILLFDVDMEVRPTAFPLEQMIKHMRISGASMMQPTITSRLARPKRQTGFGEPGVRSTDWPHLRVSSWSGDCMLETVAAIEVQAALIRRDAWNFIYTIDLTSRSDRLLYRSANGLQVQWCEHLRGTAAFRGRRSCVVARHLTMVHNDWRQIDVYNRTAQARARNPEYALNPQPLHGEDWQTRCLSVDQLNSMADGDDFGC